MKEFILARVKRAYLLEDFHEKFEVDGQEFYYSKRLKMIIEKDSGLCYQSDKCKSLKKAEKIVKKQIEQKELFSRVQSIIKEFGKINDKEKIKRVFL